MFYEMKFVWLGRLALGVLVLLLGCDLVLLTNFPMPLYALYLGAASCLVAPYFLSRFIYGLRQGKAPGPHLYRLFFFVLASFGLALVWSLKFSRLGEAFLQGLDPAMLGQRALAIFFSCFAVKTAIFVLILVCLTDAFWRGHLRRIRRLAERAGQAAQVPEDAS
ncbi:MAG: hypothetical protein C4525_13725 [Desulfarculus sp.]|nr:MAG: hypothetical protein C4525_13725 [Desulfarculus sp.]